MNERITASFHSIIRFIFVAPLTVTEWGQARGPNQTRWPGPERPGFLLPFPDHLD